MKRGLERLVASAGGPPGAIATLYRRGRTTVLAAGRADVRVRRAPRATDHMRIASIAKAFSGAVALRLVQQGRLGLDDTIGQRPPSMPAAWAAVTVRQLLNHTSGVPDYTKSEGFAEQSGTNPRGFVSPAGIIDWVRADGLVFAPGSRYEYSNTDNIVVGLIAEAVTGQSYADAPEEIVFRPARLARTSFPTTVTLPTPFIHGYLVEPGEDPEDVTHFLSPSGAWASGAVVSTPATSTPSSAPISAALLRRRPAAPAAALRARRSVEPARARHERGRPGDLPLPDPLRHRLRAHRELPRLRPVRRRDRRRQSRGHDLAQHPGADGRLLRRLRTRAGDGRLRAARPVTTA